MQFAEKYVIIAKHIRPVSQTVKTSPSHGEDRGSIPLRVTKNSTCINKSIFLSKPTGLEYHPHLCGISSTRRASCILSRFSVYLCRIDDIHGFALIRNNSSTLLSFCWITAPKRGVGINLSELTKNRQPAVFYFPSIPRLYKTPSNRPA